MPSVLFSCTADHFAHAWSFAARMAFGEFADECLLASQRVVPDLLNQTAYQFRYRNIEPALRHLLGKEATPVGASAK